MSEPNAPASPSKANRLRAAIVPVTPLEQNCTLLWNAETMEGAVFDPGGDVARIEEAIQKTGVKVGRIYLTHGHIDHASGATELAGRLGVAIEGPHLGDKFLLDSLEEHAPRYGIFTARNVSPSRWLDDGDTIDIAGDSFEIYHCPGHSPGSVVYVNKAHRFALVGDVLFAGSVGRTDFPYGDHEALIGAIVTKLLPLGDDITFVPGHGSASTFGRERQTNPFLGPARGEG
ncbi:MAG: hypothetical protein RLZ98_3164 [Pseudomonadota bacterium]